jgi:acyl-CoA thioesterase
MTEQELAEKVVRTMLKNDAFSQWLGIELLEISADAVIAKMTVRREMLNGFNLSHGGIVFSFADSALAFVANAHGNVTVSIENHISYAEPVNEGDVLIAEAKELSKGGRIGRYVVEITKAHNIPVAHFRGTVYRTKKNYLDEGKHSETFGD